MSFWDGDNEFPKQQHRFFISFGGDIGTDGHIDSYDPSGLIIPPYFIKSADRPNFEIGTIQAKYLFAHTFNFPKRLVWKPITIVFNDIQERPSAEFYIVDKNGIKHTETEDEKISKLLNSKDSQVWQGAKKDSYNSDLKKVFLKSQEYFYKGSSITSEDIVSKSSGGFPRSTQLIFYKFLQNIGYFDPNELDSAEEYLLRFRSYHFKRNMTKAFSRPDNAGTSLDLLNNNFEGNHADDYQEHYFSLNEIDQDGYVIESWRLYNPILSDLKSDKLDYTNTNILTITTTIAYDWAELVPRDVLSTKRDQFKKKLSLAKKTWDRQMEVEREKELARKQAKEKKDAAINEANEVIQQQNEKIKIARQLLKNDIKDEEAALKRLTEENKKIESTSADLDKLEKRQTELDQLINAADARGDKLAAETLRQEKIRNDQKIQEDQNILETANAVAKEAQDEYYNALANKEKDEARLDDAITKKLNAEEDIRKAQKQERKDEEEFLSKAKTDREAKWAKEDEEQKVASMTPEERKGYLDRKAAEAKRAEDEAYLKADRERIAANQKTEDDKRKAEADSEKVQKEAARAEAKTQAKQLRDEVDELRKAALEDGRAARQAKKTEDEANNKFEQKSAEAEAARNAQEKWASDANNLSRQITDLENAASAEDKKAAELYKKIVDAPASQTEELRRQAEEAKKSAEEARDAKRVLESQLSETEEREYLLRETAERLENQARQAAIAASEAAEAKRKAEEARNSKISSMDSKLEQAQNLEISPQEAADEAKREAEAAARREAKRAQEEEAKRAAELRRQMLKKREEEPLPVPEDLV